MANFAYKGRDGGGKLVEGVLEGTSAGGVADVLMGPPPGLTFPVLVRACANPALRV